jgi:hypothetical protein
MYPKAIYRHTQHPLIHGQKWHTPMNSGRSKQDSRPDTWGRLPARAHQKEA